MATFTCVADFMTSDPYSIAPNVDLASAERQMSSLRVRQLPVLREGVLLGLIARRDVALVRALALDPGEVSVAEALAGDPYTVSGSAPLAHVARTMAAQRYDCAVVIDRGQLRGILTASDALRALAQLLDRYEPEQDALSPQQVRDLILAEHAHLRRLIERTMQRARQLLSGASEEDGAQLRDAARSAYTALVAHTELEDRRLAPVLETIDAWGHGRASHLLREHVTQRLSLEHALRNLEQSPPGDRLLAASVEDVLRDVLDDMDREEAQILNSGLLSDDITQPAAEGG